MHAYYKHVVDIACPHYCVDTSRLRGWFTVAVRASDEQFSRSGKCFGSKVKKACYTDEIKIVAR